MDCLVSGLGYVVLGTSALEASRRFFEDVIKLSVTERDESTVFLGAGTAHHWARLERAEADGLRRLGYRASGDGALDELVRRLDEQAIPWKDDQVDLRADRVGHAVTFSDCDGVLVDVFTDQVTLPSPQIQDPRVRLRNLLHAVWYVSDPARSAQWYAQVLGFQASDWIEDFAVFMRGGNRYHHGLGLFGSPERSGQLDHFCILVDELDDVMVARNGALAGRSEISLDLVRHAASGSMSVYFGEPQGQYSVELCAGHAKITDDSYRARVLPSWGGTRDLWYVESEDERQARRGQPEQMVSQADLAREANRIV